VYVVVGFFNSVYTRDNHVTLVVVVQGEGEWLFSLESDEHGQGDETGTEGAEGDHLVARALKGGDATGGVRVVTTVSRDAGGARLSRGRDGSSGVNRGRVRASGEGRARSLSCSRDGFLSANGGGLGRARQLDGSNRDTSFIRRLLSGGRRTVRNSAGAGTASSANAGGSSGFSCRGLVAVGDRGSAFAAFTVLASGSGLSGSGGLSRGRGTVGGRGFFTAVTAVVGAAVVAVARLGRLLTAVTAVVAAAVIAVAGLGRLLTAITAVVTTAVASVARRGRLRLATVARGRGRGLGTTRRRRGLALIGADAGGDSLLAVPSSPRGSLADVVTLATVGTYNAGLDLCLVASVVAKARGVGKRALGRSKVLSAALKRASWKRGKILGDGEGSREGNESNGVLHFG
jgi:hypothetical protein